ncbi:MAG: hypothetical protein ACR2O8_05790 [Rhizobiaceae bacterium]
MKAVLILGSAPDALRARELDMSAFMAIAALNNAWKIRPDWTHCVYPEDFPPERRPQAKPGKTLVEYDQFVPANNAYGGVVYAGGTMAFTAGYWALDAFKPALLVFLGCDMVYDSGAEKTHFYGQGEADPLRKDPTLQSLEAKSSRLRWKAYEQGCLCANLSNKDVSRLTFDRLDEDLLTQGLNDYVGVGLANLAALMDRKQIDAAMDLEYRSGCYYENGDYWNAPTPPDASKLAQIDQIWLNAFRPAAAA